MSINLKLNIDYDMATKITIATLTDYVESMKEELKNHKNGGYMHENDVRHCKKQIKRIKKVLIDFE